MPGKITGKWRLIKMEQWEQEFVDLVEPGFISFQNGGRGEMRFGAVSLGLDWDSGADGKVDFSFEGFDELDEVTGRGWAKIIDGRLTGLVKFHQGENSGFTAEPWNATKKLSRRRLDRL